MNSFDDDPTLNGLRLKWGWPKIIERREDAEYLYQCHVCGRTFVGIPGDPCDWCHSVWLARRDSERKRLLFPEWFGWGERYWSQDETDRAIWAETRGFTRGFEGRWQRDIFNAIGDAITAREAAQVLKRNELWMTRMGKSGNS